MCFLDILDNIDQRAMILLNDYNGFSDIMATPLDFFWIWVEISNLSATLVTEVTVRLVGETIRSVLQVDRAGLRNGLASVCFTLPLHHHVRVNKRLKVSPEDLICVNYRFTACWSLHGLHDIEPWQIGLP